MRRCSRHWHPGSLSAADAKRRAGESPAALRPPRVSRNRQRAVEQQATSSRRAATVSVTTPKIRARPPLQSSGVDRRQHAPQPRHLAVVAVVALLDACNGVPGWRAVSHCRELSSAARSRRHKRRGCRRVNNGALEHCRPGRLFSTRGAGSLEGNAAFDLGVDLAGRGDVVDDVVRHQLAAASRRSAPCRRRARCSRRRRSA